MSDDRERRPESVRPGRGCLLLIGISMGVWTWLALLVVDQLT